MVIIFKCRFLSFSFDSGDYIRVIVIELVFLILLKHNSPNSTTQIVNCFGSAPTKFNSYRLSMKYNIAQQHNKYGHSSVLCKCMIFACA